MSEGECLRKCCDALGDMSKEMSKFSANAKLSILIEKSSLAQFISQNGHDKLKNWCNIVIKYFERGYPIKKLLLALALILLLIVSAVACTQTPDTPASTDSVTDAPQETTTLSEPLDTLQETTGSETEANLETQVDTELVTEDSDLIGDIQNTFA